VLWQRPMAAMLSLWERPMAAIDDFRDRIRAAARDATPLRIRGGGSKDFYGTPATGKILDTRGHAGIVSYEPTELYVTARCGTPLAELERALDENNQMLAFEPPHYADGTTVGGMVAAGLSGPRRVQAGPVRDFVLGVEIIDGKAELMRFGGRVMKNVAGYDVSRLMCGSLGTLALITEVTLKVLPRPIAELSLRFEMPQDRAITRMNEWAGRPLPISASAWHAGVLTVRLSAGVSGIRSAREKLGGEAIPDVEAREFWQSLRDQTHAFFAGDVRRVPVPPTTPPLAVEEQLLEWNGGLRWVRGAAHPQPAAPSPVLATLQERIRKVFDPAGIFVPCRPR